MLAITVKNIPDAIYENLKRSAQAHHRSINSDAAQTTAMDCTGTLDQ